VTVAAAVSTVAAALEEVSGLRVQTSAGKVNPPAALVEPDSFQTPAAFEGGSDHFIRASLLVQVGEYRDSRDRVIALADEAIAALLAAGGVGSFRGDFGTLEYGGQHYAGCVLAIQVTG
jgi:hypothetical protein